MQFDLLETTTDESFLKEATDKLEKAISQTLSATGRCVLGLSGGTTPLPIYKELSKRPLEWQNVWVFLVDDRFVSPDESHSNLRAIKTTLLDKVGHPAEQLIAPDTWQPLPECVHLYDKKLQALLSKGEPDIAVLGMGEDGHIASLFPPVAPEAIDGEALVVATHNEHVPAPDRISVTLPFLKRVQLPLFFLKGRVKRRVWLKMLKSEMDLSRWPAQAVLGTGRAVVVTGWSPNAEEK
jgi:6-phosphogluconolactonase